MTRDPAEAAAERIIAAWNDIDGEAGQNAQCEQHPDGYDAVAVPKLAEIIREAYSGTTADAPVIDMLCGENCDQDTRQKVWRAFAAGSGSRVAEITKLASENERLRGVIREQRDELRRWHACFDIVPPDHREWEAETTRITGESK